MISENQAATKIEELLLYANANLYLKHEDNIFIRNVLFDTFKLKIPPQTAEKFEDLQTTILDPLLDYAASINLFQDTNSNRILFETRIMGIVSPLPSTITEMFDHIALKKGIKAATDFLADFSVKSNYIRMTDIMKNIQWETLGEFGKLVITINRSKPEKDPKEIELAKNTPSSVYPKCPLCRENVGFSGDINHAARQTLRTIPILLSGDNWQFQFSPYVYYKNHCIALADEHYPMKIDKSTFKRMLDFLELFPHYFIGSNAALPIVGGSILAHDHFQGGEKVLPMFQAKIRNTFNNTIYRDVEISVLDWYNSVIRLKCKHRANLTAYADKILKTWIEYSDEDVNIISHTENTQHNTVTPVARLENDYYILDMILRNNRTDDSHPYGIFHPTEDLHNIKKEGIGIIEVMGLFILPGRLYEESREMAALISGEKPLDVEELLKPKNPLHKHAQVILKIANECGSHLSVDEAEKIIENYINSTCIKILECTAVFKNDEKGKLAFDKFIKTIL